MVSVWANSLDARSFVDTARAEREHLVVRCEVDAAGLTLCDQLVSKPSAAVAPRPAGIRNELPAEEVPGMRCHKVKKARFYGAISIPLKKSYLCV